MYGHSPLCIDDEEVIHAHILPSFFFYGTSYYLYTITAITVCVRVFAATQTSTLQEPSKNLKVPIFFLPERHVTTSVESHPLNLGNTLEEGVNAFVLRFILNAINDECGTRDRMYFVDDGPRVEGPGKIELRGSPPI